MSNEAPYIGSKISLISKAEIRYEGVLYAVDTKEATVTLAKGETFGIAARRFALLTGNCLWYGTYNPWLASHSCSCMSCIL